MDGIESSVGSTPSGEQGASPAPAAASGGNFEGLGNGMPAGQPTGEPTPNASTPTQNSDAAVTPDQQTPAQPEGETPAVPQLRAHAQGLEADLNNWKQLGGFEQVKSDVGLVNAMFSETPRDFWAQLHQQSPDTVAAVINAAIGAWPDYMVDALQKRGLIPSQASPANVNAQFQTATPTAIDQTELIGIDQKYHEIYPLLPASERFQLQQDDAETRNWKLEQYWKSAQHDRSIADQQRQLDEGKEAQYQQQIQKLAGDFRNTVWSGLEQQLADKLKPTGNPQIDGALSKVVRTWAEIATAQDAAAQGVLGQLNQAIDRMETRKAFSLAAPVQGHAARLVGEFLDTLAPVFQVYHSYLRSQRQNGSDRVEPPIPGTTTPNLQNNGQLPAGAGNFDADNLRNYSRQIFG